MSLLAKGAQGNPWVFIERNPHIVEELFAPDYIQHNPTIPSGRDAIAGPMGSLPEGFRYEPGMIDRLVEHWDVMQAEVPVHDTKSKNPMVTS